MTTRDYSPQVFFKNMSTGNYTNLGQSISAITFANDYSLTGTTMSGLRCLDLANPNLKNLAEFMATFVRDFCAKR